MPANPVTGYMPFAYASGEMLRSPSATVNLVIVSGGNAGAMAMPFFLYAPMLLQSVTIIQASTSNARACEFRLYEDTGAAALAFVAGTAGTFSFTPTLINARTANIGTPGTALKAGVYWLVIRNTSATQQFQVRFGDNPSLEWGAGSAFSHWRTASTGGIAALGATIDLTTGSWSSSELRVAARLNGRVFGQATAF